VSWIAVAALWILAALCVFVGILGILLPGLPGAPWAEGFRYVGAWELAAIGVLALLTYPVDLAASAVGVRRFGASGRAALGAALGALAGIFFGLPGILLGPFLGAVLGELTVRHDLPQAGRAGVGATLGIALGVAAKLALACAMLGVFALARLF
jgi:hypothetical protein